MDRDLVAAKLESLRRCVDRIAGKTPPSSQAIDWNIVYQICSRHLDDFRKFAKAVATERPAS